MKKIVFLTSTRADYGKIKSLMKKVAAHKDFDLKIFATGMHLLSKYGSTYREIEKDGFKNIYKFINQKEGTPMDIALSNSILGLSNYISEIKPDMLVIQGDRLEALAGAIVGSFNNIKVAHIEGGEVSGTIDESIRHAITKFSHIHLVANEEAKKRIIQLGENKDVIFVIGSPDIDIMYSNELPSLEEVKNHYEINFSKYAICMYHPVTTEYEKLNKNAKNLVEALINSNKKYIVFFPNNDLGNEKILKAYEKIKNNNNFAIFPSIRFESFLTLLKNSEFIIGNSSAGIRESGLYRIPAIDIGTRQQGRYDLNINKNIMHVEEDSESILEGIKNIDKLIFDTKSIYGKGNSDEEFMKLICNEKIWKYQCQKNFIDVPFDL